MVTCFGIRKSMLFVCVTVELVTNNGSWLVVRLVSTRIGGKPCMLVIYGVCWPLVMMAHLCECVQLQCIQIQPVLWSKTVHCVSKK